MKRLRAHLTYANVVATLALFLVLAGGTAFAAKNLLPKNSVGTKQLKNGAVTGAKLKDGSVTGAKIALSSLGTVPNAAHADSAGSAATATSAASAKTAESAKVAESATSAALAADAQSLQGLNPAQIAAIAKVTCPARTKPIAGTCFEESARPVANWETAMRTCAKAGRTLPTGSQLTAFDLLAGNSISEWTGELHYFSNSETAGFRALSIYFTESGYGFSLYPVSGTAQPYHCIVPPLN